MYWINFIIYILLHMEKYYFVHFCCLFLKSSKGFSISLRKLQTCLSRSILYEDVLKNLTNLTGKHLCQSLSFNKVAGLYWKKNSGTDVFLIILRNFEEHLFYRTLLLAISAYWEHWCWQFLNKYHSSGQTHKCMFWVAHNNLQNLLKVDAPSHINNYKRKSIDWCLFDGNIGC